MTFCPLPAIKVRGAIHAAVEQYDQAVAADKYAKVAGKRERLAMLLDLADASLLDDRDQSLTVSADDFSLFAEHYRQPGCAKPAAAAE
jgi:hypothetical protein